MTFRWRVDPSERKAMTFSSSVFDYPAFRLSLIIGLGMLITIIFSGKIEDRSSMLKQQLDETGTGSQSGYNR